MSLFASICSINLCVGNVISFGMIALLLYVRENSVSLVGVRFVVLYAYNSQRILKLILFLLTLTSF